ncbi:MAG TPA: hypothetical protein VNA04_17080 [Thermoanaerobaculia bacterium]|nr:hypothetical protein [Thermoanaerobaculia bacterium]
MSVEQDARGAYPFRPWVRRAGLSIVLVAAAVTVLLTLAVTIWPSPRLGWAHEPFAWLYIGALWLGGVKVLAGTFRPVAEIDERGIVLRPLHQLRPTSIEWRAILGTEQMVGGDRLIVYWESARGMRFVALNLNLVKGRRDFLMVFEARLRSMGFTERVVERSRYLKRRDEG